MYNGGSYQETLTTGSGSFVNVTVDTETFGFKVDSVISSMNCTGNSSCASCNHDWGSVSVYSCYFVSSECGSTRRGSCC